MTIIITEDYSHPEGYLFWKGEEFEALSTLPDPDGVEVKTMGEYVCLPVGVFRIKEQADG